METTSAFKHPMGFKQERLVFIPLNEEENTLSLTVKKLAQQDETTIHDLLLEALNLLLAKHHIEIGGNPQRQLFSFIANEEKPKQPEKCGFKDCKGVAVAVGRYVPKNQTMGLCRLHLGVAQSHGSRVWSDVKLLAAKEV